MHITKDQKKRDKGSANQKKRSAPLLCTRALTKKALCAQTPGAESKVYIYIYREREREKYSVVLLYIGGRHSALYAIAQEFLSFFEKISCAVLL